MDQQFGGLNAFGTNMDQQFGGFNPLGINMDQQFGGFDRALRTDPQPQYYQPSRAPMENYAQPPIDYLGQEPPTIPWLHSLGNMGQEPTINNFGQDPFNPNLVRQSSVRNSVQHGSTQSPAGYIGQEPHVIPWQHSMGYTGQEPTINTIGRDPFNPNLVQQYPARNSVRQGSTQPHIGYIGQKPSMIRRQHSIGNTGQRPTINSIGQAPFNPNMVQQYAPRNRVQPQSTQPPIGYIGQEPSMMPQQQSIGNTGQQHTINSIGKDPFNPNLVRQSSLRNRVQRGSAQPPIDYIGQEPAVTRRQHSIGKTGQQPTINNIRRGPFNPNLVEQTSARNRVKRGSTQSPIDYIRPEPPMMPRRKSTGNTGQKPTIENIGRDSFNPNLVQQTSARNRVKRGYTQAPIDYIRPEPSMMPRQKSIRNTGKKPKIENIGRDSFIPELVQQSSPRKSVQRGFLGKMIRKFTGRDHSIDPKAGEIYKGNTSREPATTILEQDPSTNVKKRAPSIAISRKEPSIDTRGRASLLENVEPTTSTTEPKLSTDINQRESPICRRQTESSTMLGNAYGSHDTLENICSSDTMSEVERLQHALKVAQEHTHEERAKNLLLKQQLAAGDEQLSQVVEEHAKELQYLRRTHSKVSMDLTNALSQSESSLAQLGTRYQSMVANLESQLEQARSEVEDLRKRIKISKVQSDRGESSTSNFERIGKKNKMQTQGLRNQLEANGEALAAEKHQILRRIDEMKKETIEHAMEKLHILKTVEQLTIEANEDLTEECRHSKSIDQQTSPEKLSDIVELPCISSNTAEIPDSKDDEIKRLKKKIKKLERRLAGKSAEVMKLSEAMDEAKTTEESLRNLWVASDSRLEQCEQELSKYVVQEMNGEKYRAG